VVFDIALGKGVRSGDTEQDHSEDAESYKSLLHSDMLLANEVVLSKPFTAEDAEDCINLF
jgi:hypothetical protein